ncbi:PAC2 family protein [Candidatus Woesearchaeota archaeon]|nr:PAC2 family protein [Candidatus Woesearchaeota archaeon]
MTWKITQLGDVPVLHKPVLIEGMPGIGNVGKIAADFLTQELHAKPLFDFFSYSFPSSVFVNEQSLVELPSITLYYKSFGQKNRQDLLFLVGDLQPIDEESSYSFCDALLDAVEKLGCREIITLGGIGLQKMPKKPVVYCTGNEHTIIERYRKVMSINPKLYGVVGPVMGVSGILLGMAGRRTMPALCLLAETYAHPMYLGIKGAQEIVQQLAKKFSLSVKVEKLDKEIRDVEEEMLKRTEMQKLAGKTLAGGVRKELEYIG